MRRRGCARPIRAGCGRRPPPRWSATGSTRRRTQEAAKRLLGEDFGGFVTSDRYVGYHWLDVLQQQLCWAHLVRQLTEISERPGAPGKLGARLLEIAGQVFAGPPRAHAGARRRRRSRASGADRAARATATAAQDLPRAARTGRPRASTPRPPASAPGCSRSTRRSGRSARCPASARRTMTRRERCAAR